MDNETLASSRDLPPPLLYKYRPIDSPAGDRLRQIIVQNELWAASPAEFNDPYDCFPRIDGAGTDEERDLFLDKFIARQIKKFAPAQRNKIARKLRVEWLKVAQDREALPQQTLAWKNTVVSMGLVSLSEDPTSLPLWAHYAANHTGVCLAFSTVQMPLILAHRVH